MKQNTLLVSIAACVLAFALAGCGSPAASSSSASSSEAVMDVSDQSITASEAAEEASDASSDSVSPSSSAVSAIWSEAKDAKAAAVGAGLDSFAVPEDDVELSIGTVKSKDWKFYFTDGIAEADGYASAATVVVREGAKAGDCTAPLSDFIAGEWPALEGAEYDKAWTQKVGDVEVTCYGGQEGVASKMIWNEDQHGFSVQVLGQGDNWANFGIEEDDVEDLVQAVIDANSDADDKAKANKDADKSNASQQGFENAEDYAEALVWQLGLGELVSYKQYQQEEGNWVLEVVTRGSDGNEYTSVIGADGSILESNYVKADADGDADDNDDENADAETAETTGTDNDGDESDDDSGVKKYSNKEAKQAVEDYDLGTYMYSQEVQGSDGNIYQEITTRDDEGNDSYSYLDSKGNVVSDVDVELRYNNDGSATPNKKS